MQEYAKFVIIFTVLICPQIMLPAKIVVMQSLVVNTAQTRVLALDVVFSLE
jgi:hypothetical protein